MIRPRGRPPTPSATSKAIEPVGITAIGTTGRSPRRITEPLPNCLSICARARSSAFSRSGTADAMAATPVDLPDFAVEFFTDHTLGGGSDRAHLRHARPVDRLVLWTIPVHLFDASRTRRTGDNAAGATPSGHIAVVPHCGGCHIAAVPHCGGATWHGCSVQLGGYPIRERVDHGAPHGRDRDARLERLIDGPATKVGDDLIGGDTRRVDRTEGGLQTPPEVAQSHVTASSSSRSRGATVWVGNRHHRLRGNRSDRRTGIRATHAEHDPAEDARSEPPQSPRPRPMISFITSVVPP